MGTTGGASDGVSATGATTYCTSLEVAQFMWANGGADFSTSTKPTKAVVDAFINRMEDMIDDLTRHAWRKVSVANEYHDYYGITKRIIGYPRGRLPCRCVYLNHRMIRAFVSGTNKIEIWNSDEWKDLVLEANGYTEGREDDYWINYEEGVIYFHDEEPMLGKDTVRVTYDYGDTIIPGGIKSLIKQVAVDLTYSDDWTVMTIDNMDRVDLRGKIEQYKEDIKQIRENYEELIVV